jgi:hypothetical protein
MSTLLGKFLLLIALREFEAVFWVDRDDFWGKFLKTFEN